MRLLILASFLLLLSACSCSKKPATESESPVAAAGNVPAVDTTTAEPLDAQRQAAEAQAEAFSQASSTVHAYLAALAGKDWPKADAYWVGGTPPQRIEDSSLRSIEDLHSLRINNDTPIALDNESPARAVEIPVTLRIRKDNAVYELKGWYRLRRTIDSESWEITSASLQPTLD